MKIDSKFYYFHFCLPLVIFICLIGLIELTRFDLTLADWLFKWEGGAWNLRGDFFFSDLIHVGGGLFFRGFILILITLWIMSLWVERLKPYKRPLLYIAIIIPVSVGLMTNVGKWLTHTDCPWDLIRYGGERPYLALFEAHSGQYRFGKCFPAGHASIGYALVALYFFFAEIAPRYKFYGLGTGIAVGLLFGISQQIRGAHFISHDLWTMSLCWFISISWYLLLFRNKAQN